jgi:AraC-like DNA-binding protein
MIAVLTWPCAALPHIVRAARNDFADAEHEVFYFHPGFHALHLHEYVGIRRIAGRDEELRPGDLTLSPGWVPSTYALPKPGTHLCIHIRPPSGAEPSFVLPLHHRPRAGVWSARMQEIIRLHRRGLDHHDAQATLAASAALLGLLGSLAVDAATDQGGGTNARLERLLAVLEATWREDLAVSTLAERAGLTQVVASRLMRQHLNITLAGWRLRRRVEEAERLLTTTTLPVGEIGRRVALPDAQHFNKVVRRFTGQSPGRRRQ